MATYLTLGRAAKRVKRSVRTIERWVADGMVIRRLSDGQRVVDEEELLRVYRRKMLNVDRTTKHLTSRHANGS